MTLLSGRRHHVHLSWKSSNKNFSQTSPPNILNPLSLSILLLLFQSYCSIFTAAVFISYVCCCFIFLMTIKLFLLWKTLQVAITCIKNDYSGYTCQKYTCKVSKAIVSHVCPDFYIFSVIWHASKNLWHLLGGLKAFLAFNSSFANTANSLVLQQLLRL